MKHFLYFSLFITLFSCKTTEEIIPKSTEKSILKFSFSQLNPTIDATIDEVNKRITATLPIGTDAKKLIPTITISPKAKLSPETGILQDFTNEIQYTVTAEDGSKTVYFVKISVIQPKSTAKEILEMSVSDLAVPVIGKINQNNKSILLVVPHTADLRKIKVVIKTSEKATISPESGSVVDFSGFFGPKFTVTAEDGSKEAYSTDIYKSVLTKVDVPTGKNPSLDVVYFVKGSTQLVAVEALTGKEIWSYYNDGASIFANPTIYNGNLIINSYGITFLNASTGKVANKISSDKSSSSSPVIQDDIMYFGTGSEGIVHAFDLKTGLDKWVYDTGYWATKSPTVTKDLVCMAVVNGNRFDAYDIKTGQKKWGTESGIASGLTNACSWNNLIITAGYHSMLAYDATNGSKKWEYEAKGSVYSSPSESDGIVYFGSYDKNFYAVNASDGKFRWSFKTDGEIDSSPFVDDEFVYFSSKDSYLYALDKKTGSLKWRFQIGTANKFSTEYTDASPVAANGLVFCYSRDSKFYALNSKTGAKVWEISNVGYQELASPCVIDKIGKVYHSGISGMQN
jgi:eukaryotic-like serine/threonine-protein kinase